MALASKPLTAEEYAEAMGRAELRLMRIQREQAEAAHEWNERQRRYLAAVEETKQEIAAMRQAMAQSIDPPDGMEMTRD